MLIVLGYPIIIRPAYTLGGTGGGIAHNEDEMYEITRRGLKLSPIHQILAERSVAGWKEIEYEVMRDSQITASSYVIWKILTRLEFILETVL
mgnify:CR=1 FL=1